MPSGMYFCPSREIKVKLPDAEPWQKNGQYVKSNLSTKGKTYLRRPSLKQMGYHFYTHLVTSVRQLNANGSCLLPLLENDWIIEEII